MISEKKKQTIKFISAISILILLFIFVVIMMIKYQVEGETNMPFELSKVVVIGTVEGIEIENEEDKAKWNLEIAQNNDIYFYISQNENNTTDELIKSIKIDNIEIVNAPQKGSIETYMPNSEPGRLFSDDKQFLVEDKLEYKGASQSSSTNLEIGSKGGTALIRFCNSNIGTYTSDKDKEIVHNSSLLQKIETKNEEIKFTVSFDFTIETTKMKYKANVSLQLPSGSLDEEENCYLEKTDMSDIVFKRVK